ncbi:MAG TPA: 23S rRNA (guanosine(2251)-2'-O)-methyltransferase RlmB, partial [Fervidobacterium sp.]|nr:23S rRNA (guanosine(2251)-2'-O)-methyltransferase RlmB [Fervidobacterium sp.]
MIVYGRNVLRELLVGNQPMRMIYFSNQHDKELGKLIEEVKARKLPFSVA